MSSINLSDCVETRDLRCDCAPRSLIISSGSADIVTNGVSTMVTNGAALVVRLMPMMSASDTFDCNIAVDAAARCNSGGMQRLTINGNLQVTLEGAMKLATVPDNLRTDCAERVFAELPIVDNRCAWEIDEGVIDSIEVFKALYDTERMTDAPNVWDICAGILQVCRGVSDAYPYAIRLVTGAPYDDVIEWLMPVTRDDLRRLAQLMLDWRDC